MLVSALGAVARTVAMAAVVIVVSWAVLVLLARRLPPGTARALARFQPLRTVASGAAFCALTPQIAGRPGPGPIRLAGWRRAGPGWR